MKVGVFVLLDGEPRSFFAELMLPNNPTVESINEGDDLAVVVAAVNARIDELEAIGYRAAEHEAAAARLDLETVLEQANEAVAPRREPAPPPPKKQEARKTTSRARQLTAGLRPRARSMVPYYEFYGTGEKSCPACAWRGQPDQTRPELLGDLLEAGCPQCNSVVELVLLPTVAETRNAAASGNAAAIAELGYAERIESYSAKVEREKLTDPSRLPDLPGKDLDFWWDTRGGSGDEVITTVSHADEVLWAEPGIWEGAWRFAEVLDLLRSRYGDRFRFLIPTSSSGLYLYGDDLSAPQRVVLSQLPDLPGDQLSFRYEYRADWNDEPRWHVVQGDRVILFDWSERPAYGRPAYDDAVSTLRARYGSRLGTIELSEEARLDVEA